MRTQKLTVVVTLMLAAMAMGAMCTARADDAATKTTAKVAAFWTTPKEAGKLMLVVPGQKDPVTTTVGDATIFGGICLDCNLPLEFKTGDTAKNCAVCGCAVSNAACIVGKPVKSNTWQAMLQQLPHGTGLVPVYNEADKPESGLKKLTVTLRSVLLPVSGLDGQTPDQLLTLVKPLGGIKAELLDGGKLLSISLKSDWTFERATKLEKALEKLNAKVVVPEETKPAL
jgi:hypothetical protein